jgi:AraC-like DNA-binding protein
MAVFVLVRAIGVPLYDPATESSNLWFILVYFIPQIIVLGFSFHCVFLALHGYATDLLEHRRRARVVFVFGMAILLILSVGNSFFSFVDPFLAQIEFFSIEPLPAIIFSLYIFVFTLGINLTIFPLSADVFALLPDTVKCSTAKDIGKLQQSSVNSTALENLRNAMKQDKLYQESGLSIARLADALSVQEYQLRRLINRELEYRNFNQFLNHYRIEDSCERLVDSEQGRLSIASIALDVGYASLSSFNKAFKEITGVTLSAYRHSGGPEDDALPG